MCRWTVETQSSYLCGANHTCLSACHLVSNCMALIIMIDGSIHVYNVDFVYRWEIDLFVGIIRWNVALCWWADNCSCLCEKSICWARCVCCLWRWLDMSALLSVSESWLHYHPTNLGNVCSGKMYFNRICFLLWLFTLISAVAYVCQF